MSAGHTPVVTLDSLVGDGGVVNGTVVVTTGVVEADGNVTSSSVVNPGASVLGFVVVFASVGTVATVLATRVSETKSHTHESSSLILSV